MWETDNPLILPFILFVRSKSTQTQGGEGITQVCEYQDAGVIMG